VGILRYGDFSDKDNTHFVRTPFHSSCSVRYRVLHRFGVLSGVMSLPPRYGTRHGGKNEKIIESFWEGYGESFFIKKGFPSKGSFFGIFYKMGSLILCNAENLSRFGVFA